MLGVNRIYQRAATKVQANHSVSNLTSLGLLVLYIYLYRYNIVRLHVPVLIVSVKVKSNKLYHVRLMSCYYVLQGLIYSIFFKHKSYNVITALT